MSTYYLTLILVAAANQRIIHQPSVTVEEVPDQPENDHRQVNFIRDYHLSLDDVPWECFKMEYMNDKSGRETPWMNKVYKVFYYDPYKVVQNVLPNPDFKDEILATHGSTFVPIILESDKTMVSVVMGQNDYYPLYLLIGMFAQCQQQKKKALIHAITNSEGTFSYCAHSDPQEPKAFHDYSRDNEEQVVLAGIVHKWCGNAVIRS
ncbi:uncharacterized protein EDB91DRAFT_1090249 [Suillus paluster]|uniref:uncharacterized protein n=1 Tax=Suillus paluster TaxID=48578 RepID=UPI001B872528|nr:uncharacterized protein EDB91DRAFT_1090249 [Suillus paluster]KAG1718175.1 hypothetical protein EDB91DRAFT_1090249 [Suillus paluster]